MGFGVEVENGVVLRGVHDDGPFAVLFVEAGVGADLGVAYHLAFVFAAVSPHVGKEAPGAHPGGRAVGAFAVGVGAVGAEVEYLIVICVEYAVYPLQNAHVVPIWKRVWLGNICVLVDSIY